MQHHGYETYSKPFLDGFDIADQFCELKPLSKITDEDAFNLTKLCWSKYWKHHTVENGKHIVSVILNKYDDIYESNHIQIAIDYLRSKGYALPFLNYSVEDLVSFGWVKLI
jgi:hypothetical protein